MENTTLDESISEKDIKETLDTVEETEGCFEDDNLKASEYPFINEEDKNKATQTENCIQALQQDKDTETQSLLEALIKTTESYCATREQQKLAQGVVPIIEESQSINSTKHRES